MYKYTEKNLLEQRENYMYTPFMGIQFIHDFFNSRNEYQNKIKSIQESPNAEIKVFVSKVETTDSKVWGKAFQSGSKTCKLVQKSQEFYWIAESELHLPKLMRKALTLTRAN